MRTDSVRSSDSGSVPSSSQVNCSRGLRRLLLPQFAIQETHGHYVRIHSQITTTSLGGSANVWSICFRSTTSWALSVSLVRTSGLIAPSTVAGQTSVAWTAAAKRSVEITAALSRLDTVSLSVAVTAWFRFARRRRHDGPLNTKQNVIYGCHEVSIQASCADWSHSCSNLARARSCLISI